MIFIQDFLLIKFHLIRGTVVTLCAPSGITGQFYSELTDLGRIHDDHSHTHTHSNKDNNRLLDIYIDFVCIHSSLFNILILFAYTVHFLNRVFTDLILGFGINVPMMVDIIAIQKLDITPLGSTLRLMQANRNSDSARMACTMNSPILMSASFLPACSSIVLDLSESMLLSVGRASGISILTSPLRFIFFIFCTCFCLAVTV